MKSNTKVLVVDDEEQNFDVIEILLFQEGYTLHFAQSGCEALDFLKKNPVDIILLDVMMPNFNGIEVCRQIREKLQLYYTPIVMVTALNTKEDLANCLEAGADDFISKPVSGIELRSRVNSMLRIKHQYDALQESLRLREDMANMIVHDFNNHLVSLTLGCDILRDDISSSRKDRQLQLMEDSTRQLLSLTDSLLIAAKLDSGTAFLQLQEVKLEEIIQSVLETLNLFAEKRKVQIICDIQAAPKAVYLDEKIIRRLIENLVSNSIKYSPANSQVKVCVEYPDNLQVRIKVLDQGRGIPDDQKLIIFNKYETGQAAQGVSQIGLGLAFCKLAVEAHQGKIFIQDNQPQGTIFIVEI
jgi:two-component system, sensor histidine kinase and response regulator